MNGITIQPSSKHNSENNYTFRDEINHQIENLAKTIKDCSKSDNSPNCTHRVVLLGDSHIKGFSRELRSILNKEYEITSFVKPGSTTSILCDSLKSSINQLSCDDLIVIGSGCNDYKLDNFESVYQNIRNYLSSIKHSNILLLSIPFRYDLHNSSEVNMKILQLNKKL